METNLSRIERELEEVKDVVAGLRREVEDKEDKWREERLHWDDEKTRLVKVHGKEGIILMARFHQLGDGGRE